jgi:hypothetical protein
MPLVGSGLQKTSPFNVAAPRVVYRDSSQAGPRPAFSRVAAAHLRCLRQRGEHVAGAVVQLLLARGDHLHEPLHFSSRLVGLVTPSLQPRMHRERQRRHKGQQDQEVQLPTKAKAYHACVSGPAPL